MNSSDKNPANAEPAEFSYRFPSEKDASWNSQKRQKERYLTVRHLLGAGSIGAELGVYKGGFGEFLLPHCRRLFLVDPWFRLKPYWVTADGTTSSSVDALIRILEVYRQEIDGGVVEVIVDFAEPWLLSLPANSLDWVYLDASHKYQSTRAEIVAACRAVKPGGYVLGDDYDEDPASNQHGVFLAVNSVLNERNQRLSLNSSRQWAMKV